MFKKSDIPTLDDYEKYIGSKNVERIKKKAKPLEGMDVAFINSTFYGGGVAEILSPFSLLMNSVGIMAEWKVIEGSPDFFSVTKKIHNALQGGDINLSELKKEIYERTVFENAVRNRFDHDIIIVHDPQPLPLIEFVDKRQPWFWRVHVDMTDPHKATLDYLERFIDQYDGIILTLKDYKQDFNKPQFFMMPAIDPLCTKNKELPDEDCKDRFEYYGIPTDLPLVVQISRFDKWKDPEGVIKAYQMAREKVDCNLVLLGNVATDDPEGEDVFERILEYKSDNIIILSKQDSALVNALQKNAAVVIQKSLREGFGLTVTEAMWKGAAVVGANVGGIKYQIKDGYNGFLVSSIEETAERIVKLIKDEELRKKMGDRAKKTVRDNFLMSRYLEDYLDLFNSIETVYKINT